jgi:hypothetical protein
MPSIGRALYARPGGGALAITFAASSRSSFTGSVVRAVMSSMIERTRCVFDSKSLRKSFSLPSPVRVEVVVRAVSVFAVDGVPQNQSLGIGERIAPITALNVIAPAPAAAPNLSPKKIIAGTPCSTPVSAWRFAATVTIAGSVPTAASGVMVTS